MTLAAVWIEARDIGNQSLCFASDSRTTPGPIEGVAKVILFGREDIAAVWAGDYRYASLIVNFLDAFFTASDAMRRRDIDVRQAFDRAAVYASAHLRGALTPSVMGHEINADAQEPMRTTIIVGGYSLRESAHLMLRIDRLPDARRWHFKIGKVDPSKIMFIGDKIKSAKQLAKQARAHRAPNQQRDWRMEPIAAIHAMCEDKNRSTIGGALQLAKVHMHGSTRAYGFINPARPGEVTVRGIVIDSRSRREMVAARLVIDLTQWKLAHGCYAASEFVQPTREEPAAAPTL